MIVSGGAAPAAVAAPALPLDDPPVVDDFNRPNENPLSHGGRWTVFNGSALQVLSTQLASTNGTAQAWRNDRRYGLDQEAMITVAAKPGDGMGRHGDWVRLYVRLQMPTIIDGYALRFAHNTSGTDLVILERFTGGAATTLWTYSAEIAAGDKLRIRAIGSTIEA